MNAGLILKAVGAFQFVLALAVVGLWVSHGADLATREKVPITVKTTDDFGDEVETVEWKEATGYPLTGFHVGLDYAAPIAGFFVLDGAILMFLGFRRRKAG